MVGATYVVALFITILDSTIVGVALPAMAEDFQVPTASIGWVSVGYLVSMAVWIPASGWLGDRFGTKRVLLVALVVFTSASILCGLSRSLEQLILFRLIQGGSAGMVSPVGTAMLFRAFPPERRARAAGILIVPTSLAPGDTVDIGVGVANNIAGSGKDAPIRLALAVGNGLEVVGDAALLQTETTQVGAVISERTIDETPLVSRNLVALTLLIPGVTATDPDSGILSYSLNGVDARFFNINNNTGEVFFKETPNYEAPRDASGNNVYDITVTATDGLGISSTKAVAIQVTDVADTAGAPVIDLGFYGKLIAPGVVDGGRWYYYWDRSGDGSSADGPGRPCLSCRGTEPGLRRGCAP